MKTTIKIISIAITLLFVVPMQAKESTEKEDIAEALFRYQFQHYSHLLPYGGAYFIRLYGKDPDDALLIRFQGHNPPVRRVSECSTKNMKVIDMQTQKLGLLLYIQAITLRNNESAQADGGFYLHGLAASGNTYFLKKENGKWMVVKDVVHWES